MIHSNFRSTLLTLAAATALTLPSSALAKDAWLNFGGPSQDFKVAAEGLAETWPEAGPPVLWSRDLGDGFSTILVDGDRLYTMYRKAESDVVIALDRTTGKTVWEQSYASPVGELHNTRFGEGPNATPLLHGDYVVTASSTAKIHAYHKADGKEAWSHDLLAEMKATLPHFGYAASPIAHDGKIFVLVGGAEVGIVAFDPASGEIVWKSEALATAYATPSVIDVGGEEQLVFMAPDAVQGVALSDGKVRWRHPHENQWKTNCIGPWYGDDGLLFVTTSGDAGSRVLKLARKGDATVVEEVAANAKYNISHSNPLRIGDHVYGASGKTLAAFNIKTGEIVWRERGYENATLLGAGDRVVVLTEEGQLSLASVSPKALEVHASHELLSKPAWTTPTLVGTTLYARDKAKMVALDLGPSANSTGAAATRGTN